MKNITLVLAFLILGLMTSCNGTDSIAAPPPPASALPSEPGKPNPDAPKPHVGFIEVPKT